MIRLKPNLAPGRTMSEDSRSTAFAISVDGLYRRFDRRPALVDVSFDLPWHSRALLVGPNGAGKSTLLRVLATLARPSAGNARVAGFDVIDEAAWVRRLIGYVGHQTYLYGDLTVDENLSFYARLYGKSRSNDSIRHVVDVLELGPFLNQRVRILSRGWQQRAALSRALLHEPRILLLDEPDAGLDEAATSTLLDLLQRSECTMLIATHSPDRFETLGTDVIRLDGGRIAGKASSQPADAVTVG